MPPGEKKEGPDPENASETFKDLARRLNLQILESQASPHFSIGPDGRVYQINPAGLPSIHMDLSMETETTREMLIKMGIDPDNPASPKFPMEVPPPPSITHPQGGHVTRHNPPLVHRPPWDDQNSDPIRDLEEWKRQIFGEPSLPMEGVPPEVDPPDLDTIPLAEIVSLIGTMTNPTRLPRWGEDMRLGFSDRMSGKKHDRNTRWYLHGVELAERVMERLSASAYFMENEP
jgi:hypothetical protein